MISAERKDFDLAVVLEHLQLATQSIPSDIPTNEFDTDVKNSNSDGSIGEQETGYLEIIAGPGVADSCGGVSVGEYLKAFTELTRFFSLTGPIFKFVARDLTKRIAIVQAFLDSDPQHYESFASIVEHELANGRARNKASATRNILRLHWALEFIVEFMDKLKDANQSAKASTLVYEVYGRTLSVHHPWITRQLAYFAVFSLPTIRKLVDIMCKQDYEEVKGLLALVVQTGRVILQYTSTLYASHNLSSIS
ncbi:ceramide-1-phosphate transfer protein-like [Watersipora subatra]|uniref:ceramide-1-phosphate transfer protein-like n=1 Tax=Watersipora subatra TaxID=2589382 RepID=UPI00355C2A92